MGRIATKGIDMNARPGGWVSEIKPEQGEVKGNVYLNENWLLSSVEFMNKSVLPKAYTRYNIMADYLEIKLPTKTGGSNGSSVEFFEIIREDSTREKYVNCSLFKYRNTKLTGFMSELINGNYSLYSKTSVKLVKGMYVSSLDMGDATDTYSKSTAYYILHDNTLVEVVTNKKRFTEQFTHAQQELLTVIEKENLSLKDEHDLRRVMEILNKRENW